MSDAPGTTTPATDTTTTTTPAPSADPYASAFPSMAKEAAPPPPAADPEEVKWRAAFPSMYAPAVPDAPTAGDVIPGAETAEGRTVTFRDVGDVTVPSALHLDPGDLSALAQAARDLRLDASAAQRLLDMHARATANLTASADAAWSETVEGWRSAVQADPEVGGAALKESIGVAQGVIAKYGSPALKQALNETGLGNHPELVRLMVRVGRALAQAESASWERVGRSLYGQ